MGGEESLSLHGSVALEHHVHLIAGREDRMRFLGAAESAQYDAVRRIAVVNGDVVVGAFLMRLHLENFEYLRRSPTEMVHNLRKSSTCSYNVPSRDIPRYRALSRAPRFFDRANGMRNTNQFYPVTRLRGEMPDAIFTAGIIIRVVRRSDRPHGRGDLVFATALLAIVAVIVQRETVVAGALIRTYSVFALVLTTAIVIGALVHIREKHGGEARFLDAVE